MFLFRSSVCGVPDAHRGEVVKAFVRLREGLSLSGADLREFLKDKLAPFELPRRIEFCTEIPKTLVGKPLRRVLVEQERRRLARRAAETEAAAADRVA